MVRKLDTGRLRASAPAVAGPALLLAGAACAEAWWSHGSVLAGDWLPCAVLAALAAAVALLAGATRPTRATATGLGLLFGLALWQGLSATWSPVPSLARDEALLTALFAVVVAVGAFTLATPAARIAALWICTIAFGGLAVVTAAVLLGSSHPLSRFYSGRLYFPITYSNAQAAFFLAGFWPGIVLAARRGAPGWARAVPLALAGAAAAGAVLAQSKGSLVGFAVAVLVVAAVSPARLRLLLAVALAAAPAAAAFRPLTAPFRSPADPGAARQAAVAVLAAGAISGLLGVVYALLDNRWDLSARRRAIGRTAGVTAVVAAVAAAALFVAAVGSPGHWASKRWASFKTYPAYGETGASHFQNLGSYRYDFWRASVRLFEQHPVAGCGARCFGPEYLLDRRSPERPQRAHSLYLDTAAEEGAVGLALLLLALGCLVAAAARGARARRGPAVAALAGFSGFLAQSAVDWTWTFAAVGIAYALLLGAGVADGARGLIPVRHARVGAVLAAALAVLVFAPPWLSARLTRHALAGGSDPAVALRWARRLDPLATGPLIAQATLAPTADAELRALRAAVAREPRVVTNRYFLGVALLNLGRGAEARRELRQALRLDPGNVSVELALARLR